MKTPVGLCESMLPGLRLFWNEVVDNELEVRNHLYRASRAKLPAQRIPVKGGGLRCPKCQLTPKSRQRKE